jgi:adenine-specific DNA-methyltransferase
MKAESRKPAAKGVQWSILQFLDINDYVQIANWYGSKLEPHGSPPPGWKAKLEQQNQGGLIAARNNLQHATRFDALPAAEQQRAVDLFKQQLDCLVTWWPDVPASAKRRAVYEDPIRTAIKLLGPDPASAMALASEIGMTPQPNAPNLVANRTSAISRELDGVVDALYRVGEATLGSLTAGLYLAPLCVPWPKRSSERERYRRRIAKAVAERNARVIVIMLDGTGSQPPDAREAELFVPRTREGGRGVTTVRALINLSDPSRYHVDTLRGMKIARGATLGLVSRQWGDALAVEAVTRKFYEEFQDLRDRMIDALLANNRDNPALLDDQGKPRDRRTDREFDLQLHAWATRQLLRVVFLWFLQQKRWLGGSPGDGRPDFLLDAFQHRAGGSDTFFADVLLPLCFDGLGSNPRARGREPERHGVVEEQFGALPYLGGGIFTPGVDAFEERLFGVNDDGEVTVRVSIPDDLFDPSKDDRTSGKKRARTVLGLLSSYHFVTQESTPDDQSIDPDPELLGKVFENLYQADERHATGAYYTPREIVQYMCRQTLDAYLRDAAHVDQDTIDWLRQEAVDWAVSDRKLPKRQADDIIGALEDVRVLDPAVGSGAFLLTMLHEIVTLRRGIEQADRNRDFDLGSVDVADWKRRHTTNCLYGVDINPMAVEICQLRLWLSMIVDLDVSNFRDIPALPNLDLHIVAGDSLVDRMGPKPFFQSLPPPAPDDGNLFLYGKTKDLQKKIDGWRAEYTNEGLAPARRRRLRAQIRDGEAEMARIQIDHELDAARERVEGLRNPHFKKKKPTEKQKRDAEADVAALVRLRDGLHDDAPFQKPFLWPVNFPEIFERGGFDIVVANPPYVRQESLDPADQVAYQHAFPEVFSGTSDLLVYFYARAVQLLRPGGQLSFITSNKYMRAAYGEKLREHLPQALQLHHVIDFGDLPMFSVAAYPAVLIGHKSDAPARDAHVVVADMVYPVRKRLAAQELSVNVDNVRAVLNDLPALLDEVAVRDYPQALLRKSGWILEEPALVRLFDRLMAQGTPLGEFVQGRMYYGIKTGLNEAFVIDEAKRAELIAADPRSAELIKPWLRGRDIRRWKPEWAGLYVIAIQNSGDADATNPWKDAKTEPEARRIFKREYPAIHEHLSQYEHTYINKKGKKKPGLRPRADQGKWWWELRACAYYREFERPKILWPEFARRVRFCLSEPGMLANNKCYLWAEAPGWALPILNSAVVEFLLCQITSQIRGSFLQLYDHFVRRLPLVTPDKTTLQELSDVAQRLAKNPTDRAAEQQADAIVRRLYRMSADEAALVDHWFARRSIDAPADDEFADDDD